MVLSIENGKTQNEQSMVNNARRSVMIMQNNLNIFNKLNIFNYGFSATNAEITKTLSVNQPIKLPPSYTNIINPELMGYMCETSTMDVTILSVTDCVIHKFKLPVPGIWCIYYEFVVKSVNLATVEQNNNIFIKTSAKYKDTLISSSGRIQRLVAISSVPPNDREQYSSTFYYTSTIKDAEIELWIWSVFTDEFTCDAKSNIIRIA